METRKERESAVVIIGPPSRLTILKRDWLKEIAGSRIAAGLHQSDN